jgi:hypothetical protein
MNTIWYISIAIDISSYDATTPLTGSGALAIFQDSINVIVPAIPTIYQTLPHLFINDTAQNNCAMAVTKRKIEVLESKPIRGLDTSLFLKPK